MVNFSSKQILNFLKCIGVPDENCFDNDGVVNLYKLLKIEPKLKADGSRELTPYEILRVPPVFVNGKEKPIVFSIKNKVKKLGKYEGADLVFYYKSKKVSDQKELIETLKSNYRRAVFFGDVNQAESYITMITEISEKEAKKLLSSFYDYTKFYRTMKKQLILDLFAHFFLMYIKTAMHSVKKGLIRTNKLYRPYRENENYLDETEEYIPDVPDIALNPLAYGIGNIEKVVIKTGDGDSSMSFDFKKKEKSFKFENLQKKEKLPQTEIKQSVSVGESSNVSHTDELKSLDNEKNKEHQNDIPDFFSGENKSIIKKKKGLFAKHFIFNSRKDSESKINKEEQLDDSKPLTENQNLNGIEKKYEY